MISLLPNQRLEVVPGSAIALKYQAVTAEILDYNETRERIATVAQYETSTSVGARVLAPVIIGGTRVVQSFVVAPVNPALSTTLTIQLVTVPMPLVGVVQSNTTQTLDVVTLAAGQVLLAEGGDAGWSVRIPAASTVIPAPGASGTILTSNGTAAEWSNAATTRGYLGLGTAALVADSSLVHIAGTETITGQKGFALRASAINKVATFGGTLDAGDNNHIAIQNSTKEWTLGVDGAAADNFYVYNATGGTALRILGTNEIAFGNAAPTAGNGLLQRAAGTTKANGDAYGSDFFVYRHAAQGLTLDGVADTVVKVIGSTTAQINVTAGGISSAAMYVDGASCLLGTTTAGTLALLTNNAQRIVISSTGQLHMFGGTPVSRPTYGAPSGGAADRSTFDTTTVTLAQLAQRVRAIIDDARSRGDYA